MRYARRLPTPPLDQFVDDIYCLTGVPRHRRLNVPPMPSAHFMINLGGPVRIYDSASAVAPELLTGGWFMGMWSRRFAIEHQAPVCVVGVHFKPWGVSPFVDAPLTELRDRCVAAEAVWDVPSADCRIGSRLRPRPPRC